MGDCKAFRQSRFLHREAMILGRDFHTTGQAIEHRLVRPPVAEFKFERAGSACQGEQLMTQADSKHGRLPQNRLDRCYGVIQRLWVARAV